MFLSDVDIKRGVKNGDIKISDFDVKRLQPASYDILLGNKFIVTNTNETPYIDPTKKIFPKQINIDLPKGGKFILHPGVSILGYSKEFFGSEKYMVEVNGKSSLARIGLLVHNSASLINPGHFLNVALELCNLNSVPIVLRPDMPIAQLTFSTLSSDTTTKYDKIGRYATDNLHGFLPPKKTKKFTKK